MTLREIVDGIKSELHKDSPIYVDDTCIYVCGVTSSEISALSGELKDAVKHCMYKVAPMPVNKIRRVGMYSHRMN